MQKRTNDAANELAMLIHDLRNPIAVIDGAARLAMIASREGRSADAYFAQIGESVRMMNSMITGQLCALREEAQQSESFTIQSLCQTLRMIANTQSEEKQMDISFRFEPLEEFVFSGGKSLLERVLGNLLTNAIKYTPEGGNVWIEAYVIKREENRIEAEFSVRDSGMGIRPEELECIFRPYARSRDAEHSSIPGFGIGLAGTKRMIEAAGGSISVNSRWGEGTEVVLRLRLELYDFSTDDGAMWINRTEAAIDSER